MFWDTLVIARDASIILLALESILFSLVPLFVFYQTARFMHRLLPQVVPSMRRVHQALLKVARIIERVLGWMRAPFIWAGKGRAALDAATMSLRSSFGKERR